MLLSFALVMAWALSVPAQSGPKDGGNPPSKSSNKGGSKDQDKGKDEDKSSTKATDPAKVEEQEKEGVVDTAKVEKATLEERFVDPRVTDELLKNEHKQLNPPSKALSADEERFLVDQSKKAGVPDRPLIIRFVQQQAAQLTNRKNVQAMLELNGKAEDASKIDEAARKLIRLYDNANESGNTAFRDALTLELTAKGIGGELAKNNIFARNQYMVILSRSRDPKAIPVFIAQLNDRDQILSVKLMAAVGLTNLVQGGRDLGNKDPGDLARAAKALSDFLVHEKDIFWPVQFRALQALGSLRVSTEKPSAQKAEIAETALSFLADPDTNLIVRAWAAWALGLLTPVNTSYNYTLVATHAGYAAVDIGNKIVDIQPKSPAQARKLTDALLQLLECFVVDPKQIRNAGLVNMGAAIPAAQQSAVAEIEKRVHSVVVAAVELDQAIKRLQPERRVLLASKVKELQDYLDAHRPTAVSLIPDGADFPFPDPKPKPLQAVEPAPKKKDARGPQAKAATGGPR